MRIYRKYLDDAAEQGLLQPEQVAPLYEFLNQNHTNPEVAVARVC